MGPIWGRQGPGGPMLTHEFCYLGCHDVVMIWEHFCITGLCVGKPSVDLPSWRSNNVDFRWSLRFYLNHLLNIQSSFQWSYLPKGSCGIALIVKYQIFMTMKYTKGLNLSWLSFELVTASSGVFTLILLGSFTSTGTFICLLLCL